jgi:hypothetical protein
VLDALVYILGDVVELCQQQAAVPLTVAACDLTSLRCAVLCCAVVCCEQLMDVPELEEEGKEDITRIVSA